MLAITPILGSTDPGDPGPRRGPLSRRHPPGRGGGGLPVSRRPLYRWPAVRCHRPGRRRRRITVDHDGQAVTLGFGPQTDRRIIRHGAELPGTGQALNGQAVANYITLGQSRLTICQPVLDSKPTHRRGVVLQGGLRQRGCSVACQAALPDTRRYGCPFPGPQRHLRTDSFRPSPIGHSGPLAADSSIRHRGLHRPS